MKFKLLRQIVTRLQVALVFLLCLFFDTSMSLAQTTGAGGGATPSFGCGVFTKVGLLTQVNPEEVYYDRFGNAWTEDEIAAMANNVTDECDAGVFRLCFSGDYLPAERDQICAALSSLSGTVSGGAPNGIVPLKIEFVPDINGDGAAASSFMRLECGMLKNFALTNIRTKQNQLPLNFFAGKIQVDAGTDWYTQIAIPPQSDWNTSFAGKVDLFTAILHEGMHILGVSSTYGGVELVGGGVLEGYTDWDRYLYKQDGANYIKFIEPANDPECCGKNHRNPAAPTAFTGLCDENIMFRNGNVNIAEVSYVGTLTQDIAGTNNRLSHLDISCAPNPQSPEYQYVMHPGIPPSPNPYSYPRRVLTPSELNILCGIGYPSGGCTSCVISANDDVVPTTIFLTGQNNPLHISLSPTGNPSITNNDVLPMGFNVTLCGFESGINVVHNVPANELVITGLVAGNWTFCYRISSTDCPGICDEATVHVTVLDAPIAVDCLTQEDCNLVCFGDFEGFVPATSSYFSQLNVSNFQILSTENSVDIWVNVNDNDSKIVHWYKDDSGNRECPKIPLSQALEPGCAVTINFDAIIGSLPNSPSTPTGDISFYGISGPPCSLINEPNCNNGTTFQLCPGIQAICLTTTSVDRDFDYYSLNGIDHFDLDLKHYEVTFIVPANFSGTISDLLIYGSEDFHYFLDNVVVTSSCNTQINVTPHVVSQCIGGEAVIQYDVCLTGTGSSPVSINLQAEIPQGFTVAPGGGFNANGLASFQLTPGLECNGGSNSTTLTLVMYVSPNYAPSQVEIPMHFVGTGLCIDPAIGSGGDAILLLQDCSAEVTCKCPANTGYEIGTNMQSANLLSQLTNIPKDLVGNCLSVNGRLEVDESFSLADCNVILNRGAEIVVKAGATLTLKGNTLYGCNHMWRGIKVESGATIKAQGNKVSDAQWAVRAENGSTIDITDNQFDANYVGIYVPQGVGTVNEVALKGNSFTCDLSLKPAYTVSGNAAMQQIPVPGVKAYAGIYLYDVTGFDIGVSNTFNGVRNGVVALNAGFTMDLCAIQNLAADLADVNPDNIANIDQYGVYASYCSLAKITNCSFNQFGYGIFSEGSNITADFNTMTGFDFDSPANDIGIECCLNTNKSVRVRHNNITTWGSAIRVVNALPASILRIKNNTVQLYPGSTNQHIDLQIIRGGLVMANTVTRSSSDTEGYGIYMSHCASMTITENNLVGLDGGTYTSGCVSNIFSHNQATGGGIDGFSIANSKDLYCSNLTSGQSHAGFYYDGMCKLANGLRCNTIGSVSNNGLWLTAGTVMGVQNNAKNLWNGSYGDHAAYNETSDGQLIGQSRFIVPDPQAIDWWTGAGQAIPWFDNPLPGSGTPFPPTCLEGVCPYFIDNDEGQLPAKNADYGDIDGADIFASQNGYAHAGFNWMARQRLYERMRAYPDLVAQQFSTQQFFGNATFSDLGKLTNIREDMDLLEGRDEYTWTVLRDLQKQVAVLGQDLQTLRSDGPGAEFNTWWLAVRQLQQKIRQASDQLKGHEAWLNSVRQSEAAAIIAQNAAVIPSNICAANQKDVNHIYLSHALWNPAAMSAATLLQVKAIADQCPADGGFAVYEARCIYRRFVSNAYWNDGVICGNSSLNRGESSQVEFSGSFTVTPNPADDLLYLIPKGEITHGCQFELLGLMGQSILKQDVPAGSTGITISVSGISSGVFFYKIQAEGKSLQSGKLIITH